MSERLLDGSFEDLLSRLLDESSAGRAERAEVFDRLREAPHLCGQYADFVQLHALLYWKESESLGALALPSTAEEASDSPPEPSLPAPPITMRLARGLNWQHHPLAFATVVAALWLGLLVVSVSFLLSKSWFGPAEVAHAPAAPVHVPVVARLLQSNQAVWGPESGEIFDGAFLRAGQLLDLQKGLAEVEYQDGVRLILQAPARLRLQPIESSQISSALLEQGRVTARVTRRGVGFKLLTPLAAVVDLGTEFGAEVEATGAMRVAVFEGAVQVESRDQTRAESSPPRRLSAGQSLRVERRSERGPLVLLDLRGPQNDFLRQMPAPTLTRVPSTISFNFCTGFRTVLAPTEVAGRIPRGQWNNLQVVDQQACEGTLDRVVDDQGAVTGAQIQWRFPHARWNGNRGPNDYRLMEAWGELRDAAKGEPPYQVVVRDLPPSFTQRGYDVYVYFDSRRTGERPAGIAFAIGDQVRFGREQRHKFSGYFEQSVGDSFAEATPGNYVVFSGLTEPEFTLTGKAQRGRAAVNGIQVVASAAPAPAAAEQGQTHHSQSDEN